MVTIEINGVRIEAETMREAQKKAKQEERRQRAEAEAREKRQEQAYNDGYAALGLIVSRVCNEQRVNLTFRYKAEDFLRSVKFERNCPLFHAYKYSLGDCQGVDIPFPQEATIDCYVENADRVLAVCVQYEHRHIWYALGIHEGEYSRIEIPEAIQVALDNRRIEYIDRQEAKKSVKLAA